MTTSEGQRIFIVGTGRTGTVFLQTFFAAHVDRCLAVHEPSRTLKRDSNKAHAGRIGPDRLRRRLHGYMASVEKALASGGFRHYVQVDPWLFGFVELLNEVVPGCRVVHVVRHPYTYIPSHLNRMYKETVQGWLRDVIPYWKLRGDQAGDYSHEAWRRLPQEIRMAWYWVRCNGAIAAAARHLPHFTRVTYESIFADGQPGLKALFAFCGFPLDDNALAAVNNRRNAAPPSFQAADQWPADIRAEVVRLCTPLATTFGYAL